MKKPYKRSGIRFYLVAIALILGQTTFNTVLAGLPVLYLGALLHVWAKGSLHQNKEVTQSGPYRYVRHPFYLAYLLIDIGVVIMSGSWLLAAVFPLWWLAIYIPNILEEEAYLEEHFPEDLNAFRRRVPALIPYRKPAPPSGKGFYWQNPNIASGTEIPRLLHILAYPLLFFVMYRLRTVGMAFFADDGPGDIFALTLMLSLYGASWMTHRHFKRSQRILPRTLSVPAVRLVLISATLSAALLLNLYESSLFMVAFFVGFVCFALALLLMAIRPGACHLIAELLALIGALTLCRVSWLSPIVFLFYAAVLLDTKHAVRVPVAATPSQVEIMSPSRIRPTFSYLTILASLIVVFVEIYVL